MSELLMFLNWQTFWLFPGIHECFPDVVSYVWFLLYMRWVMSMWLPWGEFGQSSITFYNPIHHMLVIVMCESLWPRDQRIHPLSYFTDIYRYIYRYFLFPFFFPPALLQCELGELVCEGLPGCVPLQKRCDLNADCLPFLSDESSCHGNTFLLPFNILSLLLMLMLLLILLLFLCSLYDSLTLKAHTVCTYCALHFWVYCALCSFHFHRWLHVSISDSFYAFMWHLVKIWLSSWTTGSFICLQKQDLFFFNA